MRQKRRQALTLTCLVCSNVFKRPPSQTTSGRGKYCSKVCSVSAQNNHEVVSCLQCRTEFKLRAIDIKRNKKFCSRRCYFASSFYKEKVFTKLQENAVHDHWVGKKRPEMSKENNWNWKGGIGTERHNAMGQIEYKQWRTAVFTKDNYTCQICEQYGGVLHADHIKKWADDEGLRYSVENGRALCVPCHYYITFKRKMMPGTRWCNFTARKAG